MSPTTPEEREDLILQVLAEHPEGIGFNQLQKETEMTRKTLNRYINQMNEDEKITIQRQGKKKNSPVIITANFSQRTKEVIQRNIQTKLKNHWRKYPTKTQKVNVFPHYLQVLASEYFQAILFYLFDEAPSYKYLINRLEEQLKHERELMFKEFNEKNLRRIWEACNDMELEMHFDAESNMSMAGMRKNHRTKDEIIIDGANCIQLSEDFLYDDSIPEGIDDDPYPFILDESRIDLIKDKKTKEAYKQLVLEYNQTAQKLNNIRMQMMNISGMHPFQKSHPK